jgi:hypothetical protein
MATGNPPAGRIASVVPKYTLFAVFGVLLVVVWISRDRLLLDPNSFLRQRYAPFLC